MRDRISNEAVVEALQKSGGNRRKAAADLGITVQALRRKIGLIPKNSKLKIPPALRKGTANCTHIELGNYKLPDDWEGNPLIVESTDSPTGDSRVGVDKDRYERASTYAGKMAVQLAIGNIKMVDQIRDEAIADLMSNGTAKPLLDSAMVECGVPLKIANALEDYHNVIYIRDMKHVSYKQLRGTPGFGDHTVDLVWQSILAFADAQLAVHNRPA